LSYKSFEAGIVWYTIEVNGYRAGKFMSTVAHMTGFFVYMNNTLLANQKTVLCNCPYFAVKNNKLLRFPFIHCSIMQC